MKAYLIGNVTVTDPGRFQTYRKRVPAIVEQYGGRYLVRGGTSHPLEGDLGTERFVIIEFPSMEAARRFYGSLEYAPLLKLRKETARTNSAFVEGYTPA